MTSAELRTERRERHNKLIEESGVFFAFSEKQLEEGKLKYPLREGEKYVGIGMGGFIRQTQLAGFIEGLQTIEKWGKEEAKKIRASKVESEKAILYELQNYESFYTGSIAEAFEALSSEGYTRKEVSRVYRKYYQRFAE